ncbi:ATP-binding protein [Streptomyces sp. A0958]|uniref:ATP-binding protein n=1 Tax=Streptomyces sp. A0958 TaxID=2563101 RepID=UPI00109ED38A|nr:ATP-binding protein [Streptomyces sp. A0958]THA61475.1 ATP-binding protein [Streptomyces sp. A0958]
MNHVIATRTGSEEPVYRADFAMSDHSARHLRRILGLYLKGWGLASVSDAAELALTELIGNVVRHVPGRRCQTFIFRLPGGAGVRVEVADDCAKVPVAVEGDVLDEEGRGLMLVAAVTDDWGVEVRRDGGGKTVWFECLAAAGAVTPPALPVPRR